jgi:hypothetical protein
VRQPEEKRIDGALGSATSSRADRERDIEERRARRGETDVNYGASEEQVPEIGWIP